MGTEGPFNGHVQSPSSSYFELRWMAIIYCQGGQRAWGGGGVAGSSVKILVDAAVHPLKGRLKTSRDKLKGWPCCEVLCGPSHREHSFG